MFQGNFFRKKGGKCQPSWKPQKFRVMEGLEECLSEILKPVDQQYDDFGHHSTQKRGLPSTPPSSPKKQKGKNCTPCGHNNSDILLYFSPTTRRVAPKSRIGLLSYFSKANAS
jgi:hypothetical protein